MKERHVRHADTKRPLLLFVNRYCLESNPTKLRQRDVEKPMGPTENRTDADWSLIGGLPPRDKKERRKKRMSKSKSRRGLTESV